MNPKFEEDLNPYVIATYFRKYGNEGWRTQNVISSYINMMREYWAKITPKKTAAFEELRVELVQAMHNYYIKSPNGEYLTAYGEIKNKIRELISSKVYVCKMGVKVIEVDKNLNDVKSLDELWALGN